MGDTNFDFGSSPATLNGFECFYFNAAESDGVHSSLRLSGAPDLLVPGPISNLLLGRYVSPFASVSQFRVENADDILGFTVGGPGEVRRRGRGDRND